MPKPPKSTVQEILSAFAADTDTDLQELIAQWKKLREADRKDLGLEKPPSKFIILDKEECARRGLKEPTWHVGPYLITIFEVTSYREGPKKVVRVMSPHKASPTGSAPRAPETQAGRDGRRETGNFLDDQDWRSENNH